MKKRYTDAIEDYLKAIYTVQQEQGKVTTNALAGQLGISAPSTTNMVKRLSELGLVIYQPYQGVSLTEAGRRAALQIIRQHRLVELYLVEKLDVPRDQARAYAENWEHVLSKELESRIDQALGYPTAGLQGAPIPSVDGEII